MHYNIPFNTGLIDSLTIYLPVKDIQIIDKKLVSSFVCHYVDIDTDKKEFETIDYDEVIHPPKPILISKNDINYRFNRVVFPPNKNNPEGSELIRLTLTSKMLRERYFEGINLDNLKDIVEYINSANIIYFTPQTALKAICNDIDICINYRLQFEPYKEALTYLKKCVIDSKTKDVKLFQPKKPESLDKNFGLMFGERDKGSVGTPFIKYYNKTEELLKNSTVFYNNYIFPQLRYGLDINNIIRKEITIKNSVFKRSLIKKKLVDRENPLRTLKDILCINQNQLTKICNVQLRYYFRKRVIEINSDLSPTDKMIAFLMAKLVERGADTNEINSALNLIDCKVQKSRMKKRFLKIQNMTFNKPYLEDLLTKNEQSNSFIIQQKIWQEMD